jgi:hypothetical protein
MGRGRGFIGLGGSRMSSDGRCMIMRLDEGTAV